jgi:hypothetical protein
MATLYNTMKIKNLSSRIGPTPTYIPSDCLTEDASRFQLSDLDRDIIPLAITRIIAGAAGVIDADPRKLRAFIAMEHEPSPAEIAAHVINSDGEMEVHIAENYNLVAAGEAVKWNEQWGIMMTANSSPKLSLFLSPTAVGKLPGYLAFKSMIDNADALASEAYIIILAAKVKALKSGNLVGLLAQGRCEAVFPQECVDFINSLAPSIAVTPADYGHIADAGLWSRYHTTIASGIGLADRLSLSEPSLYEAMFDEDERGFLQEHLLQPWSEGTLRRINIVTVGKLKAYADAMSIDMGSWVQGKKGREALGEGKFTFLVVYIKAYMSAMYATDKVPRKTTEVLAMIEATMTGEESDESRAFLKAREARAAALDAKDVRDADTRERIAIALDDMQLKAIQNTLK